MDRRSTLMGGLAATAMLTTAAHAAEPSEIISLWPGKPPGAPQTLPRLQITERSTDLGVYHDRIAISVAEPLFTVFRPAQPDGSAVLMAPGGGYRWVVIDKEGFEGARRLNAAGVTVFVLRYRLPADGWQNGADVPLQDAQRAMRLIRARAKDFSIDPARLGVLGFSAGGHVAASLATRFDAPVHAPIDATDTLSAKPDFVGLMYPVITMISPGAHPGSKQHLLGSQPSDAQIAAYSCEKLVTAQTPPTFIATASDDDVVWPKDNALAMYAALLAAKVPVELHVFEEGGHGFGIRLAQGKPAAAWPDLFLRWGARHGWFRDNRANQ